MPTSSGIGPGLLRASRAPGTVLGVAPPAPGAVAPPAPSAASDTSPVSDTVARPSWGEGLELLSGRVTTPDRGPRSPRHELARLVGTEGLTLCADPARVERLLRTDWQRAVALLVAAQRFGVPQELLRAVETGEVAERITYLVGQLVHVQGLAESDARWAVESWGMAVGVLAP